MSRGDRKRLRGLAWDRLEERRLLAAPVLPGNAGQVLISQFQPFGFESTVGAQLAGVQLGGALNFNVSNGSSSADAGQATPGRVANSGLVLGSQFNGGGFRTVGLQFGRVKLRGGLTVTGSDNEDVGTPPNTPVYPPLPNRGVIAGSQFSDGGFGTLAVRPNGILVSREGRVGLQWRDTRIGGPVDVGLDVDVIQPGANGATLAASGVAASAAPGVSGAGKTVIDFSTNSGQIQNSQFNDGGFGDIGMQWSKVRVGGGVGTSSNTLFIKPQQANYGPITVRNRVFGSGTAAASAGESAGTTAGRPAAVRAAYVPTTYTNAAANSGRVVDSQVNDGGFGDIGLQWSKVVVGGSVTAVHNSLAVQPQNNGQGLITVQGVQFPATPSANLRPAHQPLHALPTDPPAVAADGDPVTATLPAPTGPISPYFPVPFAGTGTLTLPYPGNYPLVNAASNSGLVKSSQFNAGGFGDEGLQWQHVRVGGNVQVVHNSLSVHPEGSKLAGVSVSDVAYGPPVSAAVARHLAVLPYAVISPVDVTPGAVGAAGTGQISTPPNDRILTEQQLAVSNGTGVLFQWNGIEHRRGLVIVHNTIQITGVGPQTGPIILSNIRFPYRVPPLGPLKSGVAAASSPSTAASSPSLPLLNAANNSGVLNHAQFNGGAFGDDGLQWKNVSVAGSVAVVHNTLAVNTTSDAPAGDVSGPITISNVTFNSGALQGGLSTRNNQVRVSPPRAIRRVSTHPVNLGLALPHDEAVRNDSANSGVMNGGQLAAGAANHVLLQWQCVKVGGGVKVIDNVLSISVLNRPSGPITISNVTFA